MGCCGDREKGLNVSEEQKWEYIVCADERKEPVEMLTLADTL